MDRPQEITIRKQLKATMSAITTIVSWQRQGQLVQLLVRRRQHQVLAKVTTISTTKQKMQLAKSLISLLLKRKFHQLHNLRALPIDVKFSSQEQ